MSNRWRLFTAAALLALLAAGAAHANSLFLSWQSPSFSFTYSSGYTPIWTQPRPVVIYGWIAPGPSSFGWGPIYDWYGCGAPPLTYTLNPPQSFFGYGWVGRPYGTWTGYRWRDPWVPYPTTVVVVPDSLLDAEREKDAKDEKK